MIKDVVDLSFPIHEGMPTDDLGPKFWDRLGHAYTRQMYQDTQSRAGRVFFMTDHTGTHLDGPLRFDPKGMAIEEVALEDVILPARVFDLRHVGRGGEIGPAELEAAGVQMGEREAAVLWTGHDLHYDQPRLLLEPAPLVAGGGGMAGRPGGTDGGRRLPRHRRAQRRPLRGQAHPAPERRADRRTTVQFGQGGGPGLDPGGGALADPGRHRLALARRGPGRPAADAPHRPDVGYLQGDAVPRRGSPTYWSRAPPTPSPNSFTKARFPIRPPRSSLSEHAGTHFDVPYHFDPAGGAIEDFALSDLVVPARLLDLTHKQPLEAIGADDLEKALTKSGTTIEPGDGAVVWTGHSRNYYTRDDYTTHRPFISLDGAEWLVAKKPAVVITDLIGLDPPDDMTSPIHNSLLCNGLCMLQVLTNLDALAEGAWRIAILPLNLTGGTGAPLRAFAVPDE